MALRDITTKQIEDYKLSRRRHRRGNKLVAEATVNRELCCLKILLRKAVEWGHLDTSSARDVKTFKEKPEVPTLLEAREVEGLLAEMPDHLRALVACAVYAGLRRQELFHLQWDDINWNVGELTVASRREHHTKNYESRRIPMNTALVEALQRHPRQLGSKVVFSSRRGRPYTDVRDSLNAAAARAGIEGTVRLHQLRHAFCSHALMQNIDPRTVQRWMGHKDLTTTMRYAHVSPDHEKAAIQRLSYTTRHQVDTKAEGG
jgi:site-specific recombinase XerD